jgi:hypothetical protein
VFGVDVVDDALSVVTVSGAAREELIQVETLPSEFDYGTVDSSASPGVPVVVLIDGETAIDPRRRLVVTSSGLDDEITATRHVIAPRSIVAGEPVEVPGTPAVLDVVVDDEELRTLRVSAADAGGALVATVYGPGGFRTGPVSVYQPLPSVDRLPPEVVELFSDEVQELFAEGLPATVDEAVAELSAAGLLDEVIEVLSTNDIAADALLGAQDAAEPGPAELSIDVGGSGRGAYRVVVATREPVGPLTAELIDG